jgi:hypothetical protein
MEIVNGFVEPIVRAAVAKAKEMNGMKVDVKKDGGIDIEERREEVLEGESLLDHLVKFTSGRSFPLPLLHAASTYAGF